MGTKGYLGRPCGILCLVVTSVAVLVGVTWRQSIPRRARTRRQLLDYSVRFQVVYGIVIDAIAVLATLTAE